MDERDCIRIAKDAKIQLESVIDIFYNTRFEFDDYKSNLDAAKRLEEIYPKPTLGFLKKITQGTSNFSFFQ